MGGMIKKWPYYIYVVSYTGYNNYKIQNCERKFTLSVHHLTSKNKLSFKIQIQIEIQNQK